MISQKGGKEQMAAQRNLDEIRGRIMEELALEPYRGEHGKFYCPLCKKPKWSLNPDKIHGKCFWAGCDFYGDVFDWRAAIDGTSVAEATKKLIEKYNPREISAAESARRDFQPYRAEELPGGEVLHTVAEPPRADQVTRAAAALPGSEGERYLLEVRKLSAEAIKKFGYGFERNHYFPGRGTFDAIVFPYDRGGHYVGWRAIKEKHYDKPKTAEAGAEPLYNAAALYSGEPVIVVESQMDVAALWMAGGQAVSCGGGGTQKLKAQIRKKAPAAPVILCFDRDEAGRKDTERAAAILEEMKIPFVDGSEAIIGNRKDPGEVLQLDGLEALRAAVTETIAATAEAIREAAQAEEAERARQTGAGMMASFLEEIQTERYKPEPTGITDIDLALEGGFTRQELVLLGAAPGVGKTALASWIFETMAARGLDCVYLNLEMSRNQMLARSIARVAARRGNKYTPKKILRGYSWTPEERANIEAAIAEYEKTVAPHLIYNPDGVTPQLDTIIEYIEKEAARAEAAGKPAPFVVLDYLQYVRGGEREDVTEAIKRALISLKGYALRHNTVVFCIMATNRDSNKSGSVTMESGRDTSNIEYTGDIVLGLTFTKCLKRKGPNGEKVTPKTPDELTKEERRDITLKILKGRGGGTGDYVDLHFDGATMTYTQTAAERDFTRVNDEEIGNPFTEEGPEYMARGRRRK